MKETAMPNCPDCHGKGLIYTGDGGQESGPRAGGEVVDCPCTIVAIMPGKRVWIWHGWYRREPVLRCGREIGYVQTSLRDGRVEVHTGLVDRPVCVRGIDMKWLVREDNARNGGGAE